MKIICAEWTDNGVCSNLSQEVLTITQNSTFSIIWKRKRTEKTSVSATESETEVSYITSSLQYLNFGNKLIRNHVQRELK